jgi:hypothetical protein
LRHWYQIGINDYRAGEKESGTMNDMQRNRAALTRMREKGQKPSLAFVNPGFHDVVLYCRIRL